MYKIEKRFTLPVGHRLSKHKGRCFSIHGHNFTILVGIESDVLNDNDMVIDFSELKEVVGGYLDQLDHRLLLNQNDKEVFDGLINTGIRIELVPYDPTAERLAERIYKYLKNHFKWSSISVDYVTVYENENSKATYIE